MAGSFSGYGNLGWWSLLRSWNASSQGLLAFKASFDESVGFCLYILSWHFQYTAFAFVYLVFPLKYDKEDSFPVLFVWCPKSFCIWISISFPNWKCFFCGSSGDKKEDIFYFYLCVSVYIYVCACTLMQMPKEARRNITGSPGVWVAGICELEINLGSSVAHTWTHRHVIEYTGRSEGELSAELLLSFLHMGPRDWTQLVKPGQQTVLPAEPSRWPFLTC